MDAQKKVDAFVEELCNVVEKHYGNLPKDEIDAIIYYNFIYLRIACHFRKASKFYKS